MSRAGRASALTLAVAAALSVATTAVDPAVSARFSSPTGDVTEAVYVVQLVQAPVLSHDVGAGERVDPDSAASTAYVQQLDTLQRRIAAAVGAQPIYQYLFSFNGFAVRVDAAEAAQLRTVPGVLAVTRSEMLQLDTVSTPDYLGLAGPGGLWEQLGGTGLDGAGEGVVIGVIDSGITPDAPSFSDPDPAGNPYSPPGDWSGICQAGEGFTAGDCSNKLIGARYYNAGYGGDLAVLEDAPYEVMSPMDVGGHGTHVASTAAGNAGVPAAVGGFDFGEMSGMAPRAHVAVYKACWGSGNDGGCSTADAVAAIDQAVADGVDVINFSISGPTNSSLDPVALAFLSAAAAGVFVATSAGNNGDTGGAGSVAHNSPWVTTVAASNHSRTTTATLTLGSGATFEGVSLATAPVGPVGLVSSVDVGAVGALADDARLCTPNSLNPELVAGKVVLCQRGVIARVDKSAAVQQAGGVGMVLVNVDPGTLNADAHTVPTVHLPDSDMATLVAYISTTRTGGTPTASISVASVSNDNATFLPALADFSSLGPSAAHGGDVIKPDISAPGVDVVAAVSPLNGGASIGVESGTSMSSPHIAGLAALLIDLHPDWSPMMIKSALLTTAEPFAGSDAVHGNLDAFDYGSGLVAPSGAADPGLVYDSTVGEWLGFLCGSALGPEPCQSDGTPVIDPSDLNAPSVSIGSLVNRQTITRRVTNVGSAGTYNATVLAPAGTDVLVSPSTLSLGPGDTGTFTVTFVVDSDEADYDRYTFGSLVWSDGVRSVRSPLAVRAIRVGNAVAVAAPTFADTCGTDHDTVTLPPVAGLTYVVNGVTAGPGALPVSGRTTIKVIAADGFYLVGTDEFEFVFTNAACPRAIVPTPPGRFLDTRDSPTIDNSFTNVGRLKDGAVTRVKIAGRGSVPPDAVGVVANLTVIGPAAPGFATLYPCTANPPVASTANFVPGEVVANNTVTALNDAGEVCVFTLASVDVALDVTGYVPLGSPLVGINPQRYLDTRPSEKAPTFDAVSSAIGRASAGETLEVQIAGRGGVPALARSVVVNVTAISPSAPGFITVYPCAARPTTSTVNYFPGQFVPNGAVSDLSDAGTLCVYTSAATDVALDVGGWLPATDSVTTTTPARFLDTRRGPENPTVDGAFKGNGRLAAGQVSEVRIAGRNGVPSYATAAVVNIAVVGPDGPGFLTLFPCGDRPTTSSVNHASGGTVRANNAIVKLSSAGTVCVFTLATTDVILDVAGWLT